MVMQPDKPDREVRNYFAHTSELAQGEIAKYRRQRVTTLVTSGAGLLLEVGGIALASKLGVPVDKAIGFGALVDILPFVGIMYRLQNIETNIDSAMRFKIFSDGVVSSLDTRDTKPEA